MDKIIIGDTVFVKDEYYFDNKISMAEMPRFGWIVKGIDDDKFILERENSNLRLFMTVTIEQRYLRKFLK